MSELAVVVEALRKEADTWDTQGAAIATVSANAEALRLNYARAGIFAMIVSEYEAAIDQIAARCREGGTEMAAIATALRANADAYERRDADVSQNIAGAY